MTTEQDGRRTDDPEKVEVRMIERASRTIPFMDLRVPDGPERRALLSAFERVLEHGRFILGPEVDRLESLIAARCDRHYAVGTGSGSTALWLAMKGLGIGVGDEVITTPLSWIATTNAIVLAGAVPIFADIGDDLNVDPSAIEAAITEKTRAVMPVHWTGRVCDMDSILDIARDHGLLVIEDAAQSFGATCGGRVAGSFGDVSCFSMNPMKVFGSCGEAGMIVVDSAGVYQRIVALRYNGMVGREVCIEPSVNGRIDTVQAAILLERLDKVDGIIDRRRSIAEHYSSALANVVTVPIEKSSCRNAWYTYTIQADDRDGLRRFLGQRGVETSIQHPQLLSSQQVYRGKSRGKCPNAERLVGQVLCIPAHEKLADEDVEYVISSILDFYG